jgi:hypothetical protein
VELPSRPETLKQVLAIENGPCVYISGDTDYYELLAHVRRLEPDVMITCMNNGFTGCGKTEQTVILRSQPATKNLASSWKHSERDPSLLLRMTAFGRFSAACLTT